MAKLKTKYEVQGILQPFFSGNKIQVTKDGADLLCDNENSLNIVSVATGQASIPINTDTKTISLSRSECNEIGDQFRDARIGLDEEDLITSFRISPNGNRLAIASKSLVIHVYSWPEKTLVKQFRSYHRAPMLCLEWDASSTYLISGSADHTARVWDIERSCSTHCLRDADSVIGCILFYPKLNEHSLVFAGVSNKLYVWQLSAGTSSVLHRIDDVHFMNITCLQHSKDGKHLVSFSIDKTAILWLSPSMQRLQVVMVGEAVSAALILPTQYDDDSNAVNVLIGGESGYLNVWRVDRNKQVFRSKEPVVQPTPGTNKGDLLVTQLVLCTALNSVIIVSHDNTVYFASLPNLHIWKILCGDNGYVLTSIFVSYPQDLKKIKTKQKTLAADSGSDDDVDTGENVKRELLVLGSDRPDIRLYRLDKWSSSLLRGHTGGVQGLSRHPVNSDVFASCSRDKTVRVWRTTADAAAECVAVAEGHSHFVSCVVLGHDLMVSGGEDTTLKSWEVDEALLQIIKSETKTKLTPHKLTCRFTQVGHEKDINCVSVSRKDKLIASGSADKTIKVWSGKDLSPVAVLRGHKKSVWSVQFSPVDKLLASASADDTIKIWMLDTMTLASTLDGDGCGLLSASWLNKGLQLLSTSNSGLLKLWEVKTGVCLESLVGHQEPVWGVDVWDDGDWIVTGGKDSRIIVWRDVTQEVLAKEAQEKVRLESLQQTLSNLIVAERWQEALLLTLRLDQPFNSLKVVKNLLRVSGEEVLTQIIDSLDDTMLGTLVKFAVQWNTRTSSYYYAQILINFLLSTRTPEQLETLPFWEDSLEALLSYTDRHYSRAASLRQSGHILDFCLSALRLDTLSLEEKIDGFED